MTKQTRALIVGLAALVIVASLVLRRPIMGLRGSSPTPAIEVIDASQQADQVVITVRNNDSNPITGEAGYALVDAKATPVYESDPAQFGPVEPAATEQLTFVLPSNRPADVSIKAWAREQIAYLDPEAPIEQGLSLRDQPDQGVTVERAAFELDAQGERTLSVDFRLENVESSARVYRYAVGLMWLGQTDSAPVSVIDSRFSAFTRIELAPAEAQEIHFEAPEADLEPGRYRVSVWVQRQDETGSFVQLAQVMFPQELIAS